ncbi:MAG: hypothetical protein Q7J04_01635, partial [Microcella sp.]|nr:hypothetical protein [Microcella sp.]
LTYPAVVDEGITVVTPFPNYELEVDCDAFLAQHAIDELGFYAELYHVPGGSLTVTFDCDSDALEFGVSDLAEIDSFSGIGVNPDDGSTIVQIDPNTNFTVDTWPGEVSAYFNLEYYPTALLANPAGSLLHELSLTRPGADGASADFGFDTDGPVYDCTNSGVKPYTSQVFTVLTQGTYTFRFVGYLPFEGGLYYDYSPAGEGAPPNPWGTYNPFSDSAMVLYSNFDPANTDAGVIDCNDDSDAIDALIDEEFDSYGGARDGQNRFLDEYYPELTLTLSPGVYTLVTFPYDAVDGDLNIQSTAKLSPAYSLDGLDDLTTEVDVWGPPGGIVLGAQLAATGADSAQVAVLGGLAAAALLAGMVTLVVRRRVS